MFQSSATNSKTTLKRILVLPASAVGWASVPRAVAHDDHVDAGAAPDRIALGRAASLDGPRTGAAGLAHLHDLMRKDND